MAACAAAGACDSYTAATSPRLSDAAVTTWLCVVQQLGSSTGMGPPMGTAVAQIWDGCVAYTPKAPAQDQRNADYRPPQGLIALRCHSKGTHACTLGISAAASSIASHSCAPSSTPPAHCGLYSTAGTPASLSFASSPALRCAHLLASYIHPLQAACPSSRPPVPVPITSA